MPVYRGLFFNGTVLATIKMAPEKIPADPTPATARPMMRAVEDGAIPHMKDPNSKMKSAERNTHFKLKKVNSFPKNSWNEQVVKR